MKKIMAVVLCLSLLFAVASCQSKEEKAANAAKEAVKDAVSSYTDMLG